MNIIAKRTLLTFCDRLPGSEQAAARELMTAWYKTVRSASWASFADVKATFNSADWVGGKVVFDVGGNKYRVVWEVAFRSKRAFVLFVGTHRTYDNTDVAAL